MGIIGVASGGAIGALLRFGVTTWVSSRVEHGFAWGTAAVNLAGCLLIGVIYAVLDARLGPDLNHPLRLLLLTGVLGAMTTYSTFALDSLRFIQEGQWGYAFGNLVVKTALGLGLCLVGMWLGRWLAGV